MQTGTLLFKNAQILQGSQIQRRDILVKGGTIVRIAEKIEDAEAVGIDCFRFHIFPGLVDVHVHLREPGFEAKETILTGSKACARGGYTTVCAMPNLNPVPDCPERLEVELAAIRRDAVIKVLPYASITKGRTGRGEIVDMASMKDSVCAFSDDGCGVQTEEDMLAAMTLASSLGVKIVAHCEVNSLLKGGYIHDGEYCRAHNHKGICSESEWAQIERDCILAEKTGCEYHVCHVSTKESVEIIRRAKARGVKVTCETCPHYLLLTDADLREDGRFKMNPPLRSAEDRDALIRGLEDGTIDCIVTDHAPHTAEEKSRGLQHSAMGIVGIETAFPLMYTNFVRSGRWTLDFLIEKMSLAPRRIFGFGGGLEEGMPADLVLMDLDSKYLIDPSEFLSKGRSTPFSGWEVYGKTIMTVVDGKTAYEEK